MATIGFIGAGNMAEAIARGLLRSALVSRNEIAASDPNAERQRIFNEELGIPCSAGTGHGLSPAGCDIVVLAVKPYVIADAITAIKSAIKPNAVIISIAAGISCRFIEAAVGGSGGKPRVIRVMPNTPMLAGKGMSALAKGTHATDEDLFAAERIFAAAGKTIRVTEDKMDAVTALSGSGPAYVFYLAEALSAAGAAAGLNAGQAAQLARETLIGAAALLEQSKDSPEELRRKVTTPNGTTQAAIESLQGADFAGLLMRAVAAAAKRSQEIGK